MWGPVSQTTAVWCIFCASGEARSSAVSDLEHISTEDGGIVTRLFIAFFEYGSALVNTVQLHAGYDPKW